MCMRFSNDEIYEYFVNPINELVGFEIDVLYDDEKKDAKGDRDICDVVIDIETENRAIKFLNYRTSLYFFNEEIVFFDDNVRDEVRYDETFDNVVYDGRLRDKTHIDMLSMFVEIFKILLNVDKVEIKFEPTSKNHTHYEIYNYTIVCKSKNNQKFEKRFSNILFIVE